MKDKMLRGWKGLTVFFAFLLAVALVPGQALAAITADSKASLTVNGLAAGDKVELYKVVDAEYDASKNALTFKYSDGVTVDGTTVDQYMKLTDNSAEAKAVVEKMAVSVLADSSKKIDGGTVAAGATSVTKADLAMGQYLIRVVPGDGSKGKVYQVAVGNVIPIVEDGEYTLSNATADVKSTSVGITKTIGTANAKTSDGYKTGDKVPFKLQVTAPTYAANATHKVFKVGDKLPTGLEFDENSLVVQGMDKDTDYTLSKTSDGFLITFNYNSAMVQAATSVTVNYEATLTATDAGARTNEATLTFTHEPYDVNGSEDDVTDKSTDYTYGLNVYKVDANNVNKPLAGAVFELRDANDTVIATLTTDATGYASTKGQVALKAGTYTLVETKAPTGYQLPTGDDAKTTVTITGDEANPGQTTAADKDDHTTTDTTETNFVVQQVTNTPNGVLPKTGDVGTIGLTAFGIALLGGSLVVLSRVLKK